jgi:hypothetical protein
MIGHGQTAVAYERQLAQLAAAENVRRVRQARYQRRLVTSAAPTSRSVLRRVATRLMYGGNRPRLVPQQVRASELSGWRKVTG